MIQFQEDASSFAVVLLSILQFCLKGKQNIYLFIQESVEEVLLTQYQQHQQQKNVQE